MLDFADSILEYGLAPGCMLLDNRWERMTGELAFEPRAFEEPAALVRILKNKGFTVLLTISPFVAIEANVLNDCSKQKRVISDPHLDVSRVVVKLSP